MSSPEKLAKTIEQLKVIEINTDASAKKKELKQLLQTLTELSCNSHFQSHKEFANYIGPSIDVLIKHYDSKESDIRLASDEGLCRVIKALIPIYSNRVLVELCRQIKKHDSPRVLKLAMTRFADLCHYARPQKQRAYLANLLSAISNMANRKEEALHESLAYFIQKVFGVMGLFAYENESKTVLKVFLENLESESATIRRSAATSITAIISTNRKSEMLLSLVSEYLIDKILLNEEKAPKTSVIIGTLITLKMIVPLYSTYFISTEDNHPTTGTIAVKTLATASHMERIVQMFELSIHYSMHYSDHNVLNAALELLLQLLKMRSTVILAIPALKSSKETLETRITSSGLLKNTSQWNVSPIPAAEESNLIEPDVVLKTLDGSSDTDAADEIGEVAENLNSLLTVDKLTHNTITGVTNDSASTVDNEEIERSSCVMDDTDDVEPAVTQTQEKETDAEAFRSATNCSLIIHAARHLSGSFLLMAEKGKLKPDRTVRVSTKCLALHCLTLLGSVEPNVWNTLLSEATVKEDCISITDVLLYKTHDDPQIRGHIGLLTCAILQCTFSGFELHRKDVAYLLEIVESILKDRETAACRLALQGLQQLLPVALETPHFSAVVPLLLALIDLSSNSYWLVRVDVFEVFSSIPWSALKYAFSDSDSFNAYMFEKEFIKSVLFRLIGDEDHRVRSAVADLLPTFIRSWTTLDDSPTLIRVKELLKNPSLNMRSSFNAIPVTINNLAEAYKDSDYVPSQTKSLSYFVKILFEELIMSRSKFVKMGCIQALNVLSSVFRPADYLNSYGCESDGSCDLLKTVIALMTSSATMLDLSTHQALVLLAGQLFAGCVKACKAQETESTSTKDWIFLNPYLGTVASDMLCHINRVLNGLCCIIEDINPLSQAPKPPVVSLPSPSALSPIRRKSKSTDPTVAAEKDQKQEKEDFGRKWTKPTQLLSQQNLGHFANNPLYVKLYDLLKATYSTCKLSFDAVTADRLSNFVKAVLDLLSILLEVGTFYDVGKHSDELLNYLLWIVTIEPVACLYSVHQLLKCLFGANLASFLQEQSTRDKRINHPSKSKEQLEPANLYEAFGLGPYDLFSLNTLRKSSPSRAGEKVNLVVKFRTSTGKMDAEKAALTAHIRLFEPMVIKALKLYTITSSAAVQKQVLDLLCELVHFCVNYCMLDAEQVFLNFLIQQFEFLEEGFIPDVEILLPSMFRFLSLLTYDRFHSKAIKTIISVPRIMQLSGGLMAAGKDPQYYVLPTLEPMVEDLFLSRERMGDNSKELETQKEVLVNILLRLIQHHQVFPLLTTILTQVHSESVAKWHMLSKQICGVLVPQLYNHALALDSIDALATLQKLFSHLDPPVVHESLLGLLQVFAPSQLDDTDCNLKCRRVLASRLTILEILASLFDEAFLLDCLSEFNLTYLVDKRSDPLNVTPTENLSAERILSSLMVSTLQLAMKNWKLKIDRGRISPCCISWETDNSFDVQLIVQFTNLFKRIINSGDFPVLKVAIQEELLREEKSCSILQLSGGLIPANPVIFVKLCALLPNEAKCLAVSQSQFFGFNGSIAKNGYFLVVSEASVTSDIVNSSLLKLFVDQILLLFDEPAVTTLLSKVFNDYSLTKTLVESILAKPVERQVKAMYQLLEAFGSIAHHANIEVFGFLATSLTRFDCPLIHRIFKDILKKRCDTGRGSDVLDSCKILLETASTQRYYAELFGVLSERAGDFESLPVINKTFVLNYATRKRECTIIWLKVLMLLDQNDFDELFANECYQRDVLLSSCKSTADLFHLTLTNFFQKVKERVHSVFQAGLTVVRLFDELSPAEMSSLLTPAEVVELCRLPLIFMSSMNGIAEKIFLLYCSSLVISRFESEISSEWSKRDNVPLLLLSIDAIESFIVGLRNGTTLSYPDCLRSLDNDDLDENVVRHAQCLSRMVTFFETERTAISEPLKGHIKSVLVAICRTPLFYSYVCIPPSVWSREWVPQFKLDMEHLTFDLPVVPSAYLHDEVIFEQFLFRIEMIGWINRQKFEEIWMTLLGIINLQNEEDVRLEEQASIVLATCKAVRAVTMIIKKNLPMLSNRISPNNESKRIVDFMQSERGKRLSSLLTLLPLDTLSEKSENRNIFDVIEKNIAIGSPSKKQSATPENTTHVDVHSCVYFLKDLYSQWLQSPDTGCALVTEVLRSLYEISNFFTDRASFEWMFDCSTNILKYVQQDDPQSLESALTRCLIKSAAFIHLSADSWELVRKHCEASLNSQYIKTRASALESLTYLLQRLVANPDHTRAATLVYLIMDYASKHLGPEKPGPGWHQSWLWTLAFYCGEHFPDLPFRSYLVIDFVVQCSLNGLLENNFQSVEHQQQILQGVERLCILGVMSLNKRKLVKMEVLNLIQNFGHEAVLPHALRTLLALIYSDFTSQLYKPGVDPEAMLVAMEWVGSLFQRIKRGTDSDASIIGRIMPAIISDMFSPADVLNRVLSEFITARPAAARCLTPTIFKVFATAREHNQQSLVFEWILFSLANFTRAASGTEALAAWNILCFFTAASENPWLHAVFPSVGRPMNASDVAEIQIFVASALDFRSKLDSRHRSTLASTFRSVKSRSPFFAAVEVALGQCEP